LEGTDNEEAEGKNTLKGQKGSLYLNGKGVKKRIGKQGEKREETEVEKSVLQRSEIRGRVGSLRGLIKGFSKCSSSSGMGVSQLSSRITE